MGLSTHILDTALGRPAAGVAITLALQGQHGWDEIGHGMTDDDGRCRSLLAEGSLRGGLYRLRFDVESYFAAQGIAPLYPFVEISFQVYEPERHYHIPLLLAANGYTTYRGS